METGNNIKPHFHPTYQGSCLPRPSNSPSTDKSSSKSSQKIPCPANQMPVVQLLRRSLSEPTVPIIRDAEFTAIIQQDIKALCSNAHLGYFNGFVFRRRGYTVFFLVVLFFL